MHIVIAFVVIAAVIAVPVYWIAAFAYSMSGSRSAPTWQPFVAILVIAFVGALVFGGIWALLVPVFGG